jgi:enamine deaminase RidA (YjgF/YER057c/UK114 family)
VALIATLAVLAWPAKKKKEEETQVLQLPKELPNAVAGTTRKLQFFVTPLSPRGLLSQQVRDALRSLERQASGATILQIRAFVAGSGDLRRVRDLVSEFFVEKKLPLPALSLVQAGALPLESAQVELAAVAEGKKELYPSGLAFVSAQLAVSPNPVDPVGPLAAKSFAGLQRALRAADVEPADVLRVTCYLSSLENFEAIRQPMQAVFPRAAWDFVQTQRAPTRALAACEAVGGRRGTPAERLEFRNPPDSARVAGESTIALVGAPQLVLTGTQVSFGYEVTDARLAFERLQKVLAPLSPSDIAFIHFYPVSPKMDGQVRTVRESFFGRHAPASSIIEMEGLSSPEAGFAVDAVAAKS